MVLTGDRRVYTSVQFIIITCLPCLIVMHLILVLFVLDLMLVMFFGIFVALSEGVITLQSVRRARLECLVPAIRRNLFLLFLLAFVIVVATIAVVPTLPLLDLTIISLATPSMVALTSMMLARNTVDLLLIMLLRHVAELTFCAILNLTLMFLCKGAVGYLQVENVLKVFCNRLERLVAKTLPAFNVLGAILGVERHVESLEL
jgi:hypothetical protein